MVGNDTATLGMKEGSSWVYAFLAAIGVH